jgi:pyruvate dehydrogenase E1 component alpha subunit
VQAYLALPHPDASAMFDCLYETLPDAMAEQLDTARQYDASGKTDTSGAHHG